jgi:hypothetical protein
LGRVDVRYISILSEKGFTVTGNLYRLRTASVEIPAAGVFLFIMTAFYIKTGKIYLGSFVGTILVFWVMAVDSVIM